MWEGPAADCRSDPVPVPPLSCWLLVPSTLRPVCGTSEYDALAQAEAPQRTSRAGWIIRSPNQTGLMKMDPPGRRRHKRHLSMSSESVCAGTHASARCFVSRSLLRYIGFHPATLLYEAPGEGGRGGERGSVSHTKMSVRAGQFCPLPSPHRRKSDRSGIRTSIAGCVGVPWIRSGPPELPARFPVVMAACVRGFAVCVCSGLSLPPAGAVFHPSPPAAPGSSAAGMPGAGGKLAASS